MIQDFGLVSVVMAVYNGEDYLVDAINSILNQTYKNIEFIIVDDGSTDKTADILECFRKSDSRILVLTQRNAGLSAALNKAIEMASGNWIARMDADDVSDRERIFKQLIFADLNKVDFCGTNIRTIGTLKQKIWSYPVTDSDIRARVLFNSPFAHPTVLGRAFLFKNNPYKESGVPAEDYELWARLLVHDEYRFGNCPEVLLSYRIHPKQISTSKSNRQQKMRNEIATGLWRRMGFEKDFVSVVNFKNKNDFNDVHSFLIRFFDPSRSVVISDSLANMAIRSKGAGFSFFVKFIFSNCFFSQISVRKKIAIFSVAIFPVFLVNRCLDFWFKNR